MANADDCEGQQCYLPVGFFFYQFHWEDFAVVPRENQLFKVKEILLLWSDAKRIFQIHQMIGTISFLYFFRNAEQL